jgi:Tol biopolymer transport system component
VTQITSAQDGLGLSDPAWSPDGKQIAVVDAQVLGPHTERHEIYLVDVVSGEFRRITDAESGEKNKAPSWSPEGKRLGLWSDEFGQSGVGYIGLESGEAVWVANSYELEWLPDNHRVAFLAGGEEGTQIDAGLGIAVRDLDTGETGVIWQDASAIQFDSVEWARNTDLVVISYESLDATGHWQPPLNRDIHVIDMNGVDQVVVATEEDETSPTWSPDAKMLAYAKGDNNNSTLWVSNADGSCAIQLLDVKRTTDPAWSPDGTRIAFMYSLDLYILDLTAEPVAERMKGLDCEDRSGFGRPDALILRKIRGVANPFASCTLT